MDTATLRDPKPVGVLRVTEPWLQLATIQQASTAE